MPNGLKGNLFAVLAATALIGVPWLLGDGNVYIGWICGAVTGGYFAWYIAPLS